MKAAMALPLTGCTDTEHRQVLHQHRARIRPPVSKRQGGDVHPEVAHVAGGGSEQQAAHPECSPSAPTTRSNRRAAPAAKATSTPESSWRSAVMESPNTNSARSRAASYMTAARSVLGTSSSLPSGFPTAMRPTRRPDALTKAMQETLVAASRKRGARPSGPPRPSPRPGHRPGCRWSAALRSAPRRSDGNRPGRASRPGGAGHARAGNQHYASFHSDTLFALDAEMQ